jgi:hypothetical protein
VLVQVGLPCLVRGLANTGVLLDANILVQPSTYAIQVEMDQDDEHKTGTAVRISYRRASAGSARGWSRRKLQVSSSSPKSIAPLSAKVG